MIYLDYNATAPLRPEARAAMEEALALPLNPSSVHAYGRKARGMLDDARRTVAEALSVFAQEVVFCASGTEANNWALRGVPGRRLLVSAIEHASVLRQPDAVLIPVDAQGAVRLEALAEMLAQGAPALVSVMLANNETGILQPIAEIAALCRAKEALLHVDASQAFGKIPVDCGLLGADMVTVSAHKCGGPPGAAALVVRGGLEVAALLRGGDQESRRRAGTENVAAVAGFAAAVRAFDFAQMQRLRGWMDVLRTELGQPLPSAPCLPNTALLFMPGVASELQLMHFDLSGICVSAGSACASGKIAESHVLRAMGMPPEQAKTAVRVSGGWATTQSDLQAFAAAWQKISSKARNT